PAQQAREQVERVFAARARGDCETMRALLARVETPQQCHELVQEWDRHGVSLVAISDSRADGRDPSAFIVRARLRRDGQDHDTLIRAVHTDGRWTIFL